MTENEPTSRPRYGEYASDATSAGQPEQTTPAPAPEPQRDEQGRVVISSFTRYDDAQAAVDFLSDEGFAVQKTAIVGHDVRIVENVQGRLTKGRAAARTAGSGAWFGLFIGLLFGIFVPGLNWIGVLLLTVGLGALWGALLGFLSHLATRGRRDFLATRSVEAGRWNVLVAAESAEEALQVLSRRR